MYTWNPQDYAQNSRGQEVWARELLSLIDLRPEDVVLDVGCGDGRTTASIAKSVPRGYVVGVDLSADMVAHASRQHSHESNSNLRFQQADAAALTFESEFSIVFSNATLHWVSDQRAAVQGIARALRPGGRFVAQMGGQGNFAEVIATFEHVARTPRWREIVRFGEMPYRFNNPAAYDSWLRGCGLEVIECRLIPKDMVHEDRTAFIGWLRTAWHPYTASIPLELRDAFLQDVAAHHAAGHAPDEQGRLHVGAVRLQVRARKPSI
jgi:trans-aconitate 2-methyltransferase